MAHVLKDHDGPCKNIHGHTYELFITIRGEPIRLEGNPANGMVMDFKEFKDIVQREIISKFDHAFVVGPNSPFATNAVSDKTIVLSSEPTSENLVLEFVAILQKMLPENVSLRNVRLRETTTSYAEWDASDN